MPSSSVDTHDMVVRRKRRGKRDKSTGATKNMKSRAKAKHGQDPPSGGLMALIPSAIGVFVLVLSIMAHMGFRGRATVAGIDLGTTNSVICVQAPAKGVGTIDCIPDPDTGSLIVPSVVSFLDLPERPVGPSSKTPSLLQPHPSAVVVGQVAKRRIDSHPHQTLYNAKRVLGRAADDPAVQSLSEEVEFAIHGGHDEATFHVGHHAETPIAPAQVGAYVVHHLMQIAQTFLGHDNVKSAVICVPAKFDAHQRQLTARAFQLAGVQVARVVEEPTAAALAYGLHRKAGVDYILVYDFGGGTLDLSLLHVSDGFVDVMGSDGDELLGGADFDAAVAHHLQQTSEGQAVIDHAAAVLTALEKVWGDDLEERLARACPQLKEVPLCTPSSFHTIGEQLKIAMSNVTDTENGVAEANCYALSENFNLEDYSESTQLLQAFCENLYSKTLVLKATDYNRLIQPLLDRSILPLTRLLKDLDLAESDIQEIVMVGGTSRMPQIRTLVHQALPMASLNTHIDPDITVAYGAASVID